jgi:hypothetical protein
MLLTDFMVNCITAQWTSQWTTFEENGKALCFGI